MKRFLAITLCIIMLVSMAVALNIGTSAYNAGDVVLDESKINDATKIKDALSDKTGSAELSWNAETGRLHVKAKGQGIITVKGFDPDSTDKYTISGDFYVKDAVSVTGAQPRIGLGIYSGLGNNTTGWTNGAFVFFQGEASKGWNTTAVKRYVDGNKLEAAGWTLAPGITETDTGLTNGSQLLNYAKKVSFKIVVDPSVTDAPIKVYHDDVLVKSAGKVAASKAGEVFLYTRNCEFEVDNFKVSYDGTGSGAGTVPVSTMTWATPATTKPGDTTIATTTMALPTDVKTVYYPNGTIILNEDMIKKDVASAVKASNLGNPEDYSISWNAETDKLRLEAKTTSPLIANFVTVPTGLDYYTVTGKFTMITNGHGEKAMMGLGINSGNQWSRSAYIDAQIYSDRTLLYMEIMDKEQNSVANMNITKNEAYVLGTTEYTFKIVVDKSSVVFYANDEFVGIVNKEALPYPQNVPFILLRSKCSIEVDDIMVYAGVGEPDPTKVIGEVGPIDAPEEITAPTTEATTAATTPAATTTVAPTPGETTTEATTVEEKSGCGSSIGFGVAMIAISVCTTGAVCRRRRK